MKRNWDPEAFFLATNDEIRNCHNVMRFRLFEKYKSTCPSLDNVLKTILILNTVR